MPLLRSPSSRSSASASAASGAAGAQSESLRSRASTGTLDPAPPYPPLSPTPAYTRNARAEERALLFGSRPPQTGVITKSSKHITLVLGRQPDSALESSLPQYGRIGPIEGKITLNEPALAKVLSVHLEIEGAMKLSIAEGGKVKHSLLHISLPLYDAATSNTPCPSTLNFRQIIPTTYNDNGNQRPLPPTYEVHLPGVPGLRATVKYTINVTIVRKKFWNRKETLSTPFMYYPRTRPPRPAPDFSFLPSLKTNPEDWSQFISTVPLRAPAKEDPITSSLILPSIPIFPLKTTIHFHLQLSALRASTLRPLLDMGATVRVFLQRQISIDVRSQRVLKTVICGEGCLSRVDLEAMGAAENRDRERMVGVSMRGERQDEDEGGDDDRGMEIREVSVGGPRRVREAGRQAQAQGSDSENEKEEEDGWAGWEGKVVPNQQVRVGGFRAGGLWIKDFITLIVIPPNPHSSPIRAHQHAVPIRMVTDSWDEDWQVSS
ncbi:hypothetical protein BOTBODRAFT_51476 [Botryobasidium botryosum FD-172 SS1]|uniref:Arrestin-like N-terminal domain-containing protein n=1 Tax=Botryobasidium botryosum (strain FD-172 SS1) TaxID=930990 RepID=A0A067MZK5_BOTB1|nr:hypothetical protein BOTBODRAFT_51476 [Botryobasidium botryosum FD-172 SS1]